jgi:ankyrin repeat protein
MTELHWAAYCGAPSELERQLKAGADPNLKDHDIGYKALHGLADMAATGGPRIQMLHVLVNSGADLNLPADHGATALCLAIQPGSVAGEELASRRLQLGAIRKIAGA